MQEYNHQQIETKWQKKWDEWNLYKADDNSVLPKKYVLGMFPYPSGAGLHVGHPEGYTATDICSRYWRMKGYNVLQPMGWDAFGLPAENYAIKSGIHPAESTNKNIDTFRRQIKSLGLSYDWDREINTSSPDYYRWTQWFFLFLHKNGLAYKKKAKVNWCDSCQTVLANEQVINGKCDRCGNEVTQKDMAQWFFKITDYANQLLDDLDKIDWPEPIKIMQKNWIGRSEGAEVVFPLIINNNSQRSISDVAQEKIKVFTTRIDTIFSGTFLIIAPEHDSISKLQKHITNWDEVEVYIKDTQKKNDIQRTDLNKEKSGVELKGVQAINPATKKQMPIWIADFVLSNYGTGVVFADAHDERDFIMAKKYNIPLQVSIKPADEKLWQHVQNLEECFSGEGVLVNSEQFNGLTSSQARPKIIDWLSESGMAKATVNYRLRDWLVSRQRYWGAPIPIIYCDHCGEVPVPEKDLPVLLPDDVDFKPTGESPLQRSKSFHNVVCPSCQAPAKREVDTMDTFVCSSWYYFRYTDPKNNKEFADTEKIKKWLPVDLYVGGAEHAVLHLLYARFFTKVLSDKGVINFDEPFLKLKNQGMILAEDGRKMSKSLGNVINPDEVVENIGADAMRMYEMFMGPLEDAKPWSTRGIVGLRRFLEKIWHVSQRIMQSPSDSMISEGDLVSLLHKTIKKVTEDIENMKFNTAISAMMIFVNEVQKVNKIKQVDWETFLILLSPFAPHIAEELWEQLGHKQSIFKEGWPEYKYNLVAEKTANIAVQVNGKLRDTLTVPINSLEADVRSMAQKSINVSKWLQDKKIIKVVFISNKLINIVVK